MGPWGWGPVALALLLSGVSIFALPPLLWVGLGALVYTIYLGSGTRRPNGQ